MIYKCTKCGYEVEAEKQPDLCMMCYAARHHMVPKKDDDATEAKKEGKGSLA